MKSVALILLCILTGMACKTQKPSSAAPSNLTIDQSSPLILSLSKGTCFGSCPSFRLEIYEAGQVLFLPKVFTLVKDTSYSCWKMGPVLAAFEEARLHELEDAYMQPISDIPTYTLRYREKTIKWNAGAPEVLYNLMALLDAYSVQEGWIEGKEPISDAEPSFAPGELIIQLHQPDELNELLRQYEEYNMILARKLDPGGNYILIQFDPERIDIDDFLVLLRQNDLVKEVSKNRRVDLRE